MNLNRFIPKFLLNLFQRNSFFNNAYLLGQTGPVWISVVQPYELYNTIPELRAVVDKDASMFSNMKIYKRDKKTKEIIEDPDLMRLLDNPNATQSQNQWLKQYRQQFLCYGNQFIYKNKVNSKSYPVSLWNISPAYLQPVLTGKMFDQVTMDGIISKYQMINTLSILNIAYGSRTFLPEEILFTKVNNLNNPIIGTSPIAALKYPLSNIEAAYERGNVIMKNVAIGVLSPDSGKDIGGGMLPLNTTERKNIEEQFGNDYGMGMTQRKTILANTALKWQSMSVETNKLLLLENIDAGTKAICNLLGVNSNIFLQGTTFENLRSGIIQTYQDSIIPAAEEFMQALSPFVGLKPTEELCGSFEHLSIMKENKLRGMQAIESIVKSLSQAVETGLISKQQATNILATELGLNAASY